MTLTSARFVNMRWWYQEYALYIFKESDVAAEVAAGNTMENSAELLNKLRKTPFDAAAVDRRKAVLPSTTSSYAVHRHPD